MKLQGDITGRFMEINIIDNCEYELFYIFADLLKQLCQINYTKKIGDFDSLYWNFEFENTLMTLHYSVFLGISIYPQKVNLSSETEYDALTKIFQILILGNITDKINNFKNNLRNP